MPDASVRVVLAQAHSYGDEGDFTGMAEHLRAALVEHPDNPFVLCWLGVAERELGLDSAAYQHFRACLATRPSDPHLLATAGNAVAALDDPSAEGALRTATLLAPELPLTRWLYGAWLAREGMIDDGLRELGAARDLDPHDPAIRFELGVTLYLAGRREAAIDELYRAVDLSPGDGWTHVVLGLILSEDGCGEEAAGVLERGARLRPEDVDAQLLAGLAAAAFGADACALEMVECARQIAEGADRALVDEVERRIEEGPEEAAAGLAEQIGPVVLRERIMMRP